jgi:glycosidase
MTTWFRPSDRNNAANDGVSVAEEEDDAASLLSHYRQLIRIRSDYPTLSYGDYERVQVTDGPRSVYAYLRQDGNAHLLVVLNFSRDESVATLDLGATALPAAPWTATDLLSGEVLPPVLSGTYSLKLPPLRGAIIHLKRP